MQQVLVLAKRANDVLQDYLKIQNGVFRFSFAKALGFRKPNYRRNAEGAGDIVEELEDIKMRIKELCPDGENSEGQFLMTLRAYVTAMLEAVENFRTLCLTLESRGHDKKYRRTEYAKDMKRFQDMETAYLVIGRRLNERLKVLKEPVRPEAGEVPLED